MAQKAYRSSANDKKAKGENKKSKIQTEYQKTRDEFNRKKRKAPRPSPVTGSAS